MPKKVINLALVRAIRESGLKQYIIAERVAMHPTTFSRIVNGHLQPTDIEQARIARVLGKKSTELFSGRG